MNNTFRFKKDPDIIAVELKHQKVVEDITHLAYFICPACSHMGMLAYGDASEGKEREDYCVYCGQKVSYRIPETKAEKKETVGFSPR